MHAGFEPVLRRLARLRRSARLLLIVQRLAWLVAGVLVVGLMAGVVDFLLRWPRELRVFLWALTVGTLVVWGWRLVVGALRFAPSLTQIALRLESLDPALRGWLASGVDLSVSPTQAAADSARVDSSAASASSLSLPLELRPREEPRPPSVEWERSIEYAVVDEAVRRVDAARITRAGLGAILRRDRAYRGVAALAGIMIALFLLTLADSQRMGIGARRVMTPWTRIDWPKRTGVADATGVRVHPVGTALALRAGLTKTDRAPAETRVWASFRLVAATDADRASSVLSGEESGGGWGGGRREIGSTQRLLLTHQNRPVDPLDANTGTLFERLVEPTNLAGSTASRRQPVAAGVGAGGGGQPRELVLEYWFETEDDRTETSRLLLVEPPQVVNATLSVTPPSYARSALALAAPVTVTGSSPAALADESPREIDLGNGTDERASPGPLLGGSKMQLRVRLNKPLPMPEAATLPLEGDQAANWARATLGESFAEMLRTSTPGSVPRIEFAENGAAWLISWRLDQPARVMVRAVDEHQIESVEDAVYSFEVQKDEPPTASIVQPGEDRSVLATAIVDVLAEARDDVGLTSLRVERQQFRRPTGSAGAPVEPLDQPAEFAVAAPVLSDQTAPIPANEGATDPAQAIDRRRLEVTNTLDLSTLDLRPGDELWITAIAKDAFELDGKRHEPVRSIARKLRIMSRQDLVEQVWAELAGLRRTAITLEEDQRQSQQELATKGASEAAKTARSQAGLGERIARQEESIERAERQLEANQLDDEALKRLLEEARRSIRGAAAASADAARAASKSGEEHAKASDESKSASGSERAEAAKNAEDAAKAATEAQQQVREDLTNLAEMLDQGQDTWASKRAIERLIEEQKRLKERTAQAGAKAGGRSQEQLSPQEQGELRALANEQSATAEKVREAIEKMQERQEQMKRSDPAAAQGMQQAAQRARQEGVQDRMQQAAEQIQQNQTSNAQQQQQRATEALEQMLKDLEQSAQNKDQVLRRFLANLMDEIAGLIDAQKNEIQALIAAEASGDDRRTEALAAPMAALHQRTLGVLDEAANGPRQTQGIAKLIDRAARAQQNATTALRDRPINLDEALDQEQASLKHLQEALSQAEETDEQAEEREEARARGELKKKYEQTLERQIVIKDATTPLVGAEANRRTRNSARLLGQDQEALRAQMQELASSTTDLKEAKVFEFAHQRLDTLMKNAAAALDAGAADAGVVSRQTSAVRILQSMIDSLDNRRKKDKAFRENEQASGGGGGQGGGQGNKGLPPAAELRLLRSLQDEAMRVTRELGERAGAQATAQEVSEAAALQREIAEQARLLLQKVSQQGGPAIENGGKPGAGQPPAGGENPPEPPIEVKTDEPSAVPAPGPQPEPAAGSEPTAGEDQP